MTTWILVGVPLAGSVVSVVFNVLTVRMNRRTRRMLERSS